MTPKALIWHMTKKRALNGVEKLIFQGFPVDKLKLTHMDEKEPELQQCAGIHGG